MAQLMNALGCTAPTEQQQALLTQLLEEHSTAADFEDLLAAEPGLLTAMQDAAGNELGNADADELAGGEEVELQEQVFRPPITLEQKLPEGQRVGDVSRALTEQYLKSDPDDVFRCRGQVGGKRLAQLVTHPLNTSKLPHRQQVVFIGSDTSEFMRSTLSDLADVISTGIGTSGFVMYHAAPTQITGGIAAPCAMPADVWFDTQAQGKNSNAAFKNINPFPLKPHFHMI